MRKNDVRKWLHAILDLLPLIVIPVFMIYSHRHNIDSYFISREENVAVYVEEDGQQVFDYWDTEVVTYDDTDIGSQFVYSLYDTVDNYFNLNKIFNFGEIKDYFDKNIFDGNMPIAVEVVWDIVLYEFVMDLIFLIYALFMFFIDACSHLIDGCFHRSRG